MTTLLGRVTSLRTAAVAVDDVVKIKNRTGELKALSDRLQGPLNDLPRFVSALAELAKIDAPIDVDSLQDAADGIAAARALANSLPGLSIDAPLDIPKSHVKTIENLVKKLRAFIEAHWLPYRDQELPPINEDLVEALAAGGVDVEDVRSKLISAQSAINGMKHREIPQAGDIDRFATALETLRSCGEEISTLVDPALADGILMSQTDGVSLAWFTPDRIAAVTDLGILDRFRVHLK